MATRPGARRDRPTGCPDVAQVTIPDPDGAIVAVPCSRGPHHAGGHSRRLTDRKGRVVTILWADLQL